MPCWGASKPRRERRRRTGSARQRAILEPRDVEQQHQTPGSSRRRASGVGRTVSRARREVKDCVGAIGTPQPGDRRASPAFPPSLVHVDTGSGPSARRSGRLTTDETARCSSRRRGGGSPGTCRCNAPRRGRRRGTPLQWSLFRVGEPSEADFSGMSSPSTTTWAGRTGSRSGEPRRHREETTAHRQSMHRSCARGERRRQAADARSATRDDATRLRSRCPETPTTNAR